GAFQASRSVLEAKDSRRRGNRSLEPGVPVPHELAGALDRGPVAPAGSERNGAGSLLAHVVIEAHQGVRGGHRRDGGGIVGHFKAQATPHLGDPAERPAVRAIAEPSGPAAGIATYRQAESEFTTGEIERRPPGAGGIGRGQQETERKNHGLARYFSPAVIIVGRGFPRPGGGQGETGF